MHRMGRGVVHTSPSPVQKETHRPNKPKSTPAAAAAEWNMECVPIYI
jgi:hypothetical protein